MPTTLLCRQAAGLLQHPDHRIQRVGDADDECVGGILLDALADLAHHLDVDAQQVVAAHAGLAGNTGSHDDHVGTGDIGVVGGAGHGGIEPLDGRTLGQIKALARAQSVNNVKDDDVAQFLHRRQMRQRAANVAAADQRNLFPRHILGPPWIGCLKQVDPCLAHRNAVAPVRRVSQSSLQRIHCALLSSSWLKSAPMWVLNRMMAARAISRNVQTPRLIRLDHFARSASNQVRGRIPFETEDDLRRQVHTDHIHRQQQQRIGGKRELAPAEHDTYGCCGRQQRHGDHDTNQRCRESRRKRQSRSRAEAMATTMESRST